MNTTSNEQPKSWGGARKGAGRKKTCAKRMFFSATEETLEILNSLDRNKSDFINECILKAMGRG